MFSGVDLCSSPRQDRAIACVFWSRSLQQSTARQSYCLCFLKQISAAAHGKTELLLVFSEADLCSSPQQGRVIACVVWSRSLQQSTARQSYCLCFLEQISVAVHSKTELLLVFSEADLCSSPQQDRAIARVVWSRSLQQSTARQSYCLCFLEQISAAVHSKTELLLVLSEADLCSSPRHRGRAIACVF